MSRVRKAWKLKNKLGEVIDLSSQDFFFHSVEGMGFDFSNKYEQIGNRFNNIASIRNMQQVKGKLLIKGDDSAVKKYMEFVEFCNNSPLKILFTSTLNGIEYTSDVILKTLIKKRDSNKIECNLTFDLMSNFYKEVYSVSNIEKEKTQENIKQYPYVYPYSYSDTEDNTSMILVDSGIESGTVIEIYGPCSNPSWKYYVEGKLQGTGKTKIVLDDSTKLVVDTTSSPFSIQTFSLDNKLISNVYELSDFGTQRFFLTKKGKNRVSVSDDTLTKILVTLKGRIEYVAV